MWSERKKEREVLSDWETKDNVSSVGEEKCGRK